MIVKLLGIIDILIAVLFWMYSFYNIIPVSIILVLALILLAKSVAFLISKDIASVIDVACAIIIFVSLSFTLPVFIPIIVSLFLLQKGVFSLL